MVKKYAKKSLAGLITLFMLIMMMPMTVFAASTDTRENVSAGGGYVVNLSTTWAAACFAFTPSVTGYYAFTSNASVGDPYFFLTTASNRSTVFNSLASTGGQSETARTYSLTYNDDSGASLGSTGRDFKANYLCYAGVTYYCFASKYSNNQTNYMFYVSQPSYNSVTLNRNGGTGGSSYYYNNGAKWLYTSSSSATNYITPPTRSGYIFTGYYTATSGGTRYVDSNGYISGSNYNGTLYAQWQQNVFTLTYNNQGAANTTATVSLGSALPSSVAIPARTGYTFNGYYTASSGGTQYYTSTGARNTSATMSGNMTLYAQWSPRQYTVTYNGMSGASYGANKPSTHTYGQSTTVSDPTKADYTFMGWSINGGNTLSRNLVLASTSYTGNISLTANWKKTTDVTIEDDANLQADTAANQADLKKVFENPVTDTTKGVTLNELSNNASVTLKLTVKNTVGSPAGEEQIKEAAQGEVVKFFDAKVVKEVTALNQTTTTTTLKEIPVNVAVTIPLTGDLANKKSYSVFRYHTYLDKYNNNIEEIHQISDDPSNSEYYVIENGSLVVYTRMFSTFAIAAGETTISPTPSYNGTMADASSDIDVQGRISQKGLEAIYKLDVTWGNMLFNFTVAKEWDPYNHTYSGASYKWSDESFLNGNNKITTTNHSNADVYANFALAKEPGQLENVEAKFKAVNSDTSDETTRFYIPKVTAESAQAISADTYLWLSGTPTNFPGGTPSTGTETPVTKVGVITMTITPDEAGGLTPKS